MLVLSISCNNIFIYLPLILPSGNCVWEVSCYNESISRNLSKTTDMWTVGVAKIIIDTAESISGRWQAPAAHMLSSVHFILALDVI